MASGDKRVPALFPSIPQHSLCDLQGKSSSVSTEGVRSVPTTSRGAEAACGAGCFTQHRVGPWAGRPRAPALQICAPVLSCRTWCQLPRPPLPCLDLIHSREGLAVAPAPQHWLMGSPLSARHEVSPPVHCWAFINSHRLYCEPPDGRT